MTDAQIALHIPGLSVDCPVCKRTVNLDASIDDGCSGHRFPGAINMLARHINWTCSGKCLNGQCYTCHSYHSGQYESLAKHMFAGPCGDPWRELFVLAELMSMSKG